MRDRKRWIKVGGVILAVLLVSGAVYIWVNCPEESLRASIAEAFAIDEPRLLVMNLPPKASRYPGGVILTWTGIPFGKLTSSDDSDLSRGTTTLVSGTHDGMRHGEGSVAQALFNYLIDASRSISLQFDVQEARAVEMPAERIRERVENHIRGDDDREDESRKLTVILRSYEGQIRARVKRKSDVTAEAWAELRSKLESAREGARVRVSSGAEDELVVQVEEPVVFAFEAARADEFLQNVPRTRRRDPVRENDGSDPETSIRALLEFDPERIPSLPQALLEIGPGVESAILNVMRTGDRKVRERGRTILKKVPDAVKSTGPTAEGSPEPDRPVLRAREILALQDQDASAIPKIKSALQDENPAVRFLAIEALQGFELQSEELIPQIERSLEDADAVNRDALHARVEELRLNPAVDPRIRDASRRLLEDRRVRPEVR